MTGFIRSRYINGQRRFYRAQRDDKPSTPELPIPLEISACIDTMRPTASPTPLIETAHQRSFLIAPASVLPATRIPHN